MATAMRARPSRPRFRHTCQIATPEVTSKVKRQQAWADLLLVHRRLRITRCLAGDQLPSLLSLHEDVEHVEFVHGGHARGIHVEIDVAYDHGGVTIYPDFQV